MPSPKVRWTLVSVALLITVLCETPVPSHVPHAGLLRRFFVDPWLLNYDAGFVRRGFVGAIGHALGDITHNLIVLHVIGVAAAGVILWFVLIWISRSTPSRWPLVIASVAVALSPLTGVFVQTVGDTAHLTLVGAASAMTRVWRWPVRWALPGSMILIAVLTLIHEGAVFLVGPAMLVLFWLRGAVLSSAILGTWLAICALGLSVVGQISPTQEAQLIPTMTASWWPGAEPVLQTPRTAMLFRSFRELYAEEGLSLSSPVIARRTLWLVRVLLVPALVTVLFGAIAGRQALRTFRLWLLLLFGAAPLFLIGHDWGRFAVYLWIMALAVVVTTAPSGGDQTSNADLLGVSLVAALLVVMNPLNPMYHVYGITNRSLLIGLLAGPCVWWAWRTGSAWRAPR